MFFDVYYFFWAFVVKNLAYISVSRVFCLFYALTCQNCSLSYFELFWTAAVPLSVCGVCLILSLYLSQFGCTVNRSSESWRVDMCETEIFFLFSHSFFSVTLRFVAFFLFISLNSSVLLIGAVGTGHARDRNLLFFFSVPLKFVSFFLFIFLSSSVLLTGPVWAWHVRDRNLLLPIFACFFSVPS